MEYILNRKKLELVIGDVTAQDTEAVVNAANSRLAPGGGVAGAIHRAAGPGLWEECSRLGGCATGEAKLSGGHNLPNKYVIHTVGPVYSGSSNDPVLLSSCYRKSLEVAEKNNIKTISFPALSTGIFGYPVKDSAEVAFETIIDYLKKNSNINLVRMVLYDEASYKVHAEVLKEMTGGK
jgi:O-acetyl-ADP-ribose deacetylase (regulator of RNase III)